MRKRTKRRKKGKKEIKGANLKFFKLFEEMNKGKGERDGK